MKANKKRKETPDDRIVTIYVPMEVTIPGDRIAELEAVVRHNWEMAETEEVSDEDLLLAANGTILDLPDDWRL